MPKTIEDKHRSRLRGPAETPDVVLGVLMTFGQRLANIEQTVAEVQRLLRHQSFEKDWYTTTELAEALGVTQYTVQERYCNARRIACEKDPATGKWRIPGAEYRRLVKGGAPRPKAK
jgi:hypothetical protein